MQKARKNLRKESDTFASATLVCVFNAFASFPYRLPLNIFPSLSLCAQPETRLESHAKLHESRQRRNLSHQ